MRTTLIGSSGFAAVVMAISLAGCVGTTAPVYRMYDGPEKPAADIASLVIGTANVTTVTIGEKRLKTTEYSGVLLAPGTHSVTVECLFGASVMVSPDGFIRDSRSFDILLQAGHSYSPRCERSHGYGYNTYIWISDDTVDMAAAGERKP